ncbi:hypothetical protein [Amycolatopsis sp. NBC_00438]|uniref:hypothetical protein n=1 Tax=Amycolatopsis sp. NBC_00438 TaxID=2903558 RepID=UPI002E1CC169
MEEPEEKTRKAVPGRVFRTGSAENVNGPARPRDYPADGLRALARKDYNAAVAALTQALRAPSADPALYFHLALAQLRGNRPHRVGSARDLNVVRDCLDRVGHLAHARVLLHLTDEDRGRLWERGGQVPARVSALVEVMAPEYVEEILDHVTAPENRVWQLLRSRRGKTTAPQTVT